MRIVDVTVPPSVEPVTLDEAKHAARVTIPDDDDLIAGLIVAARGICEEQTSRAFLAQTITYTLDSFPYGGGYFSRSSRLNPTLTNFLPATSGEIPLPRPPFLSLIGINYVDPTGAARALDLSGVRVLSGSKSSAKLILMANRLWPTTYSGPGAVQVIYRAGYGTTAAAVPETVKLAIKLLVSHWYNNTDAAADGTLGEMPFGVQSLLDTVSWGAYQ